VAHSTNFFEVDRDGLRKIAARRGYSWVLFELIQNSWDEQATRVSVVVEPTRKRGIARLSVEDDDPDGFVELRHAWTLFADSPKRLDPTKRGFMNLGDKLAIAAADEATIRTTTGTVVFDRTGRHTKRERTKRGSIISATVQLTREQIEEMLAAARTRIPPGGVTTLINREELPHRVPVASFEASLPTTIPGEDGAMRRTQRKTTVHLYDVLPGERSSLYEMGIPVVETGDRYHYSVCQRVPLNMERDNVPPSYLQTVRVHALNAVYDRLSPEVATSSWVRLAAGDQRANDDAIVAVLDKRFGSNRLSVDPSDREAEGAAKSHGDTVVPGGALTGSEWDNAKRIGAIKPAGRLFPSARVLYGTRGKKERLIPKERWKPGMAAIARYARKIGRDLIDADIKIRFVAEPTVRRAAWYGERQLTFNVGVLGYAWFAQGLTDSINELLIHELGHEYESDHLSSKYHDGLSRLGARLASLALAQPELFTLD
jgi:hypothetical protein